MITLEIDPKGLSESEIQRAIDSYLAQAQQNKWRYEYESRRRAEIAQKRVAKGKRLRLVNALKRASISVVTQDSKYGLVSVDNYPSAEGFYDLSLRGSSYYPRRWTDETRAEWDNGIARLVARLQAVSEIEFHINTSLEDAPSWSEDKTPRLVTRYTARLVADIKPEEAN